jgi:signal transduction histidine kinase
LLTEHAPTGGVDIGEAMRFRGKSIRRKIVALLLVPLLSLVSICAFAGYLTSRDAVHLLTTAHTMEQLKAPVEQTAQALQRERRQVLVYLADPRNSDALASLRGLERSTDKAAGTLRTTAHGVRGGMSPSARSRLDALTQGLDGLDAVRTKTEKNTITRGGAFQAYNDLVDPCYGFMSALHGFNDVDMEKQGQALTGIYRAREYLSREDALMAAALAAGTMTRADQRAFTDQIADRNLELTTNLQQLPVEDQQAFQKFWNGTDGRTLLSYEDAIIQAGQHGATDVVSSGQWHDATSSALDDLKMLRHESHMRYQKRMQPASTQVLVQAGAALLLGAAAVVASLIISFRVGRGLVRDLSTLRKEANESAGVRLPSVMRRLAAGEQVDVETEAPRLEYPPDETGQVGQALNTLQRAAVEAAVKQADMRRGVSEVFVNLARRNQVLLHRQLTLLDTMERRTEDGDELADLFKLDHLTTRMRRHAEGLVILSGAAPSRQWRKPVQLMDVVRAAVGEVEDYERIEVRRLPRLAVVGGTVADLTHLIAELLENATVFSPPHTAVQVLGERVANGFTLEIHDRGLGMTADALLDANLRLAETPEFELSDTDRLGLFVVSRLAQRQGVRVSLQPSPYGGTTAVVLIPDSALTESTGHAPAPDRAAEDGRETHGGPQQPVARRRHAALGGPVELEAPREEHTEPRPGRAPVEFGGPRRRPAVPSETGRGREQHQHARDEVPPARTETDTAGGLPRRRRTTPVLVSDHGRPVGEPRPRPEEGATPSAGLPRRVRQASLAPQLKEDRAGTEPQVRTPRPERAAAVDDRDADEVRSRMSSLQRGWQRGRRHNDIPSGDDAGTTAPGTTPEGDGR